MTTPSPDAGIPDQFIVFQVLNVVMHLGLRSSTGPGGPQHMGEIDLQITGGMSIITRYLSMMKLLYDWYDYDMLYDK